MDIGPLTILVNEFNVLESTHLELQTCADEDFLKCYSKSPFGSIEGSIADMRSSALATLASAITSKSNEIGTVAGDLTSS